ncbi:MAG: type II secretion system F family protein [Candidatus Diapherotrites archaeon]|uniref:Type II secretion system F family protein n=1 Tax=Candidatus Iainarchaeum sp. TaxID=3101447 RepID=A0A8T3YJY3_9ARCH|nr:type II secretion system F family protein [Candidatus Diapherotrites archaeon]
MYERFSSIVPKPVLSELKKQINYNNLGWKEKEFAGLIIMAGLALSALASGAAYFLYLEPLIIFPITLAGFFSLVYALLKLNSESKGKFVETILPDALQIIASNMKSGLTTEKAIFVAGRPEFGPLQLELRNASKSISSGERVEAALLGIGEKINSAVLGKTLWLITEGIRSGGQISDLLLQLAQDLRNQQGLQDEIKANTSIYVLLILFASMAGAPLLFGVSSFIVQSLTKQIADAPSIDVTVDVPSNLQLIKGTTTGKRTLPSVEFITLFSIISMALTSILASLTIGVINTGKEINGLKYIVPITAVSVIVFFAVKAFFSGLFQGLI